MQGQEASKSSGCYSQVEAHLVGVYEKDTPRGKRQGPNSSCFTRGKDDPDMFMKEGCWKKWYFSKTTQVEGGDGEMAMQAAVNHKTDRHRDAEGCVVVTKDSPG